MSFPRKCETIAYPINYIDETLIELYFVDDIFGHKTRITKYKYIYLKFLSIPRHRNALKIF